MPVSESLLTPTTLARPATTTGPQTALVVRSDATGVWCVPVGQSTSSPIGPCRGGSPGGQRIPLDTVVLLVRTDHGPWVAAVDEEASP